MFQENTLLRLLKVSTVKCTQIQASLRFSLAFIWGNFLQKLKMTVLCVSVQQVCGTSFTQGMKRENIL